MDKTKDDNFIQNCEEYDTNFNRKWYEEIP